MSKRELRALAEAGYMPLKHYVELESVKRIAPVGHCLACIEVTPSKLRPALYTDEITTPACPVP